MQKSTISVVIPAYNEERYIGACLEALLNQTHRADEIIVVDNNSSDETALIAASYAGVRVIKESKQGTAHARTRGFNEASGDIIARIDADTVVAKNWVEALAEEFSETPIDAISGPTAFYDVPMPGLMNWLLKHFFFSWNHHICGVDALFGSNMALRRELWPHVRTQLSDKDDVWEDLELALALRQSTIARTEHLEAAVSMRSAQSNIWIIFLYMLRWPRTFYRQRRLRGIIGSFLGLAVLSLFSPILYLATRWVRIQVAVIELNLAR